MDMNELRGPSNGVMLTTLTTLLMTSMRMTKFDRNYNDKNKFVHEENTLYFGLYFLKAFEIFRLYMLIPCFYAAINCLIIKHGVIYYRFFEFFLFFTIVVLLFFAEVSKYNNQLFARD